MNGSVVKMASTWWVASAGGASEKGSTTVVKSAEDSLYGFIRMSAAIEPKLNPGAGKPTFLPLSCAIEVSGESFGTSRTYRPGDVCELSATIRRFRLGTAFSAANMPT